MINYEINFKNIPLDLEPDENIILWRYMSFSSLCEILMYDHIPLISISKFSDKSEGAILKGILSKLPNTHNDGLEYAMQKYYETVYVSSWHKSKNENAAMWDRYTYGSEGVAIKTNAKLLLGCIKDINSNRILPHDWFSDSSLDKLPEGVRQNPQLIIKPIKYTNNNPTNFDMKEKYLHNGYDKLCFFYKLEDFKDESEVRILKAPFANPYSLCTFDQNMIQTTQKHLQSQLPNPKDSIPLKINSANKLIQQIVVSPYAHNQFKKTIEQSIVSINLLRQIQQVDIIECDIIESKRKEWV